MKQSLTFTSTFIYYDNYCSSISGERRKVRGNTQTQYPRHATNTHTSRYQSHLPASAMAAYFAAQTLDRVINMRILLCILIANEITFLALCCSSMLAHMVDFINTL